MAMRWMLIGLEWLALALLTTKLVGGAARLGGPDDPRRTGKIGVCQKCGWTGDYYDAPFKLRPPTYTRLFIDDLESYCPECGGVLETGA